MDPITIGAAAAGLAGSLASTVSNARMNRKSMRFSEKMYEKQKFDNRVNWDLQNQYNSPQAQMQRLQDAGLNPALIYGGSSGGAAGTASSVETPTAQTPQFRPTDFNALGGSALQSLLAIADLDIKKATANNLETQNTVLANQALLTETRAERERFDLGFETELRDVSADARREKLRQLQVSTDLSINEDTRRALTTSSSLNEARERIETMQIQRANLIVDRNYRMAEIARIKNITNNEEIQGKISKLDLALRQKGINPNDPMYARVLGTAFDSVYDSYKSLKPENKFKVDRLLQLLVFKR